MTDRKADVNEHVMVTGDTLTLVAQFDRSLFDGPTEYPYAYDPKTQFVPLALRRLERVLREAVAKEAGE